MTEKIAVVAIVQDGDSILVGKKIKADGHFLSEAWHVPGGSVKDGETEEAALVREMQEEAGIKIKVGEFLDQHVDAERNIRVRWYLCLPLIGNLKPGDDLAEVKFIPKTEILKVCDPKAISLWPPKVVEYFKN